MDDRNDDRDDGVLRMIGGPYDGGEVDAEYLFAGRTPDKLAIAPSKSPWRAADYDLDIDADGLYYRFVPPPSPRARPSGTPITCR